MRICELIEGLDVISVNGDKNIDIKSIVYDSRRATSESLFVAIKGFIEDGHKYVGDAIKNGASAVLVEDEVDINENITVIKVRDTRSAMAKVAANFYDNPSELLNIIGITGTNGKTTTAYFVKSIFEAAKMKIGVIGSLGYLVEDDIIKTNNTTPEAVDLQRIFNELKAHDINNCVMEVSSHSLELSRVENCNFNVGIFTNLSQDHLDYHKNLDNYLNAKAKLFYKTQKANIINIDDEHGRSLVEKISELDTDIITYGISNEADIKALNVEFSLKGANFLLNTPKGNIDVNMKVLGLFNIYNGLAAAACGYAYNIDLTTIKKGLEKFNGVKGRFEIVPTDKDFTVIIDFAHTPDGLEKVLTTISQFAEGRKVVLFGAGGDRDRTKRPILGEIASKYSDLCIVTSDNPRTEDPNRIIEDVLEGVKKGNADYVSIVNRRDAIEYALRNSKPKDVILLAGKGHETYTIIGKEKLPFNEKDIVLEIIDSMK